MGVGDQVKIQESASVCCYAEDGGLVGTIVKVRHDGVSYVVESSAGRWNHCQKCITKIEKSGKAI